MTYDEMCALATLMAKVNVDRKLKEMMVEKAVREHRIEHGYAAKTQDWLLEHSAMFDAVWALKELGYSIVKPQPDGGEETTR